MIQGPRRQALTIDGSDYVLEYAERFPFIRAEAAYWTAIGKPPSAGWLENQLSRAIRMNAPWDARRLDVGAEHFWTTVGEVPEMGKTLLGIAISEGYVTVVECEKSEP